MTHTSTLTPAVAIVGAGPSGLTAAAHLAGRVSGGVLVLDRERRPGGIPRHSDHPGYGLRDLRRNLSGPHYAERLTAAARRAGAKILTEATVTHITDDRELVVTTPQGRRRVTPDALILATGARERPRSARLIPGDRPAGVYTTGQLQNLVHLHHRSPGRRAVIVGAELVSWSAVLTLRHAGCRTVLMTTGHRAPEVYGVVSLLGRHALRTRVATSTQVIAINGRDRVKAVTLRNTETGRITQVECDTVILTGDWIPDNELARALHLDMDPGSRSPVVDPTLRTSRDGVFAIGNLVHPVDTADVAALDGRHVAQSVLGWLTNPRPSPAPGVPIVPQPPLRWVAPSRLTEARTTPARRRLLAWTDEYVALPAVTVRQDGRTLATKKLPWPAAPGRVFRIPSSVLKDVNHRGGEVLLSLA